MEKAPLNELDENTAPIEQPQASLVSAAPMQSPPKSRIRRLLILAATCLIVLAVIAFVDFQAISDTMVGFSYQPSAEIAAALDNIELTEKGERIFKASKAELQDADDFNRNCPSVTAKTSVLGCYYDWHIYVYDVQNDELDGIKEAVLAHELLHAVWQREREHTKEELEPILRAVYKENEAELEEHMKGYNEDDYVDELHSVIGTQIVPSSLPSKLREHYADVFKDHERVVNYFNQYNNKFVALRNELETLGAKIDGMKKDIEQRSEKYRNESSVLANDIATFNRNAENGYYSGNIYGFEADRSALVRRQSKLNEDYEALTKLVDETNALVDEYNKNVVRSGELYDSINSNVEKVKDVEK